MGFCDARQYLEFMRQTPQLERMLVNSGIKPFKFWFSVSREEQLRRFISRRDDQPKHWKLSPIDILSLDKCGDYTAAKQAMSFHSHSGDAPWTVEKSDGKKRARLGGIRYFLSRLDYPGKDRRVARAQPADSGRTRRYVGSGRAGLALLLTPPLPAPMTPPDQTTRRWRPSGDCLKTWETVYSL
ncbi:hypothetical protein BI347_14160 [Chromobacterium sphagni]|uniref:Polyphosphate kinase-2-related domain-containing protein n=1 Tax=Chromobacterium sphagni TaxID=1903179 RepID=A0A1S1X4X1_9NEIS|nr:hypothetical protein BI347_14160 [Chromobacterium sphagni]